MKFLKLGRNWSYLITVMIMLFFIAVLTWMTGPPIYDQIIKIGQQLPSAFEKLKNSLQVHPIAKLILSETGSGTSLFSGSLNYLTRFFSTSFSYITDILIIFIIGGYLGAAPQLYLNAIYTMFPPEKHSQLNTLFSNWGNALKWWLVGRFASMIIVGILIGMGLWIAGIDLALALGIISAILSFIQFIGPIISYIPAVLIGFAQNSTMALYVTIIFLVVQSIESYLLTPMIEKRVVSLPPALVIVMQFAMGFLFGIFGVLLASPIAVVIIILIQLIYIRGMLNQDIDLLSKTDEAKRSNN